MVKRHHDHGNIIKEKYSVGVAYIFRGLDHYHHGATRRTPCASRHSVQEDMELELRVLHLDWQAIGSELRYWAWLEHI